MGAGAWLEAAAEHALRLSFVTTLTSERGDSRVAARVWVEYAVFALRALGEGTGRLAVPHALDLAQHALREALRLTASSPQDSSSSSSSSPESRGEEEEACSVMSMDVARVSRLRGCVLLEQGRLREALDTLYGCALREVPELCDRLGAQRELASLRLTAKEHLQVSALTSALLCVACDAFSDGPRARAALVAAAAAVSAERSWVPKRYCAVAALLDACAVLLEHSLAVAAARALRLAHKAQAACATMTRAAPPCPQRLEARGLELEARLRMLQSPECVTDATLALAHNAVRVYESANALRALGDALRQRNQLADAAQPYARAIKLLLTANSSSETRGKKNVEPVPLQLRARHAHCPCCRLRVCKSRTRY